MTGAVRPHVNLFEACGASPVSPIVVLSSTRLVYGTPDYLPVDGRRLYPAGRLDRDTTGLVLLTDDGDLAFRVTPRPRSKRAPRLLQPGG